MEQGQESRFPQESLIPENSNEQADLDLNAKPIAQNTDANLMQSDPIPVESQISSSPVMNAPVLNRPQPQNITENQPIVNTPQYTNQLPEDTIEASNNTSKNMVKKLNVMAIIVFILKKAFKKQLIELLNPDF